MQKIAFKAIFLFLFLTAPLTYLTAFSTAPSSTRCKSHKITEVPTSLLEGRLKRYIKTNDYYGLGLIVRDALREGLTFQRLKQVALQENFQPLVRAVNASVAIVQEHQELDLDEPELIRMATFIETILPLFIAEKKYYLSAEETGLLCAIEYDPVTQYRFIHLGYDRATRLGRGAYKTVTKSILYKEKHPAVLARCKQTDELDYELEMTQKLQGIPGIVKIRAHTTHQENDTTYHTLFCKLYDPGSLSRVLGRSKKYHFTQKEKMMIALNVLRGLEGLQKKGIVHKDLGTQNYLINIVKNRKGKTRKIDTVISDFGCSIFVQDAAGVRAQGHSAYTAPEAIFVNKMKGEDYFRSDLFAVGCLFYQLFYEEKPRWVNVKYIKGEKTEEERYNKHVTVILRETKRRRRFLSSKLAQGYRLSSKEEFERLVLRMCSPIPEERGTAFEHRLKIEQLIQRVGNHLS